jgi:quinol monooxygenase YgiN
VSVDRRTTAAVIAAGALAPGAALARRPAMYGLIGQMKTTPGGRDPLAKILTAMGEAMPGCLSYVVALDPDDADSLWVTEVWDRKESHAASLKLPAVQAAVAQGRPLIAGFGTRIETTPVGGHGLIKAG